MFYLLSRSRSALLLATAFLCNSFPRVVEGDSAHEHGDGEVASVPFPGKQNGGWGRQRMRAKTMKLKLYETVLQLNMGYKIGAYLESSYIWVTEEWKVILLLCSF